MSQKPYASDWHEIAPDVEYSQELKLYWHKGRVYDQRSADHNGIVGMGAALRRIAKGTRESGH